MNVFVRTVRAETWTRGRLGRECLELRGDEYWARWGKKPAKH